MLCYYITTDITDCTSQAVINVIMGFSLQLLALVRNVPYIYEQKNSQKVGDKYGYTILRARHMLYHSDIPTLQVRCSRYNVTDMLKSVTIISVKFYKMSATFGYKVRQVA